MEVSMSSVSSRMKFSCLMKSESSSKVFVRAWKSVTIWFKPMNIASASSWPSMAVWISFAE
eukprot:2146910-Pyramimonas_sp.AAC.1